METIKPPRLRLGDRVAVVSTSWGGPSVFPRVYERGLDTLERVYGLRVQELRSTRLTPAELRANPRLRADDLNAAFDDPEVRAIFMSIGGNDSVRILDHLDASLAVSNPKIVLGFSDSTTQLTFYNQAGLVTFNGPSVMAGFAQLEQFDGAVDHVRAMLFEPTEAYTYSPAPGWVDCYREWTDPGNDGGQIGELRAPTGWHWLQGHGRVEGRLFGGCGDVLEMVKGTRFWPGPDFWQDRILFIETSEDKPPPSMVGDWLRSYGVQGVFDRVSGILVGRARGYTDDEKAELDETVVRVVAGEFDASVPIVSNLDFGHTDPQWILPLGVRTEIDVDARSLRLLEPAVT